MGYDHELDRRSLDPGGTYATAFFDFLPHPFPRGVIPSLKSTPA